MNLNSSKTRLVVIVGGLREKVESTHDLESVVREKFPGGDTDILNVRTGFSLFGETLHGCTVSIMRQINEACRNREYAEVVLVGYSMGSLAVRKAWMAARWASPGAGEHQEVEGFIEPCVADAAEQASWACKVQRIVLLGSMDLGWRVSHHFGLFSAFAAWLAGLVLRPLAKLRWLHMPVLDCERGSPFVESLRIQWGRLLYRIDRAKQQMPLVVQIFGTLDEIVGPEEAVDPLYLKKTKDSGGYVCMEVPESAHKNLVFMADRRELAARGITDDDEVRRQATRRAAFASALVSTRVELEAGSVLLAEESQLRDPTPDVKHVVFVIHGIRDTGYWTQHLAQRIKMDARQSGWGGLRIVSETSSYGYFAMLPFVASRTRRKKVQWLFDQYAENVALYPGAEFHFVGHSNGTYMLASALEQSRCVRFGSVAFAGSVVRRGYPWQEIKRRGQVRRFANYLATCDWVVAVFPWAFGMFQAFHDLLFPPTPWRRQREELGAAGDKGFKDCDADDPDLANVGPVGGGHGAAIAERNWPYLADFIVNDQKPPAACESLKRATTTLWFYRAGFTALFGVLAWALVRFWPWAGPEPSTWISGIAYATGLIALYKAVTRL